MNLSDIFKGIHGVRIDGDPSLEISGIRYDSRRTGPGDLFAAVPGEHFDGTRFIEEAAAKGARAFLIPPGTPRSAGGTWVVAENVREALARACRNFFHDPDTLLEVVGITGTNGKTTSSYLMHGVLEVSGKKAGLIGTVQYLVGGQIISAARTTPESCDLYAMLNGMIQAGCQSCIMEVSSHAIVLERVTGLVMKAGVFTNLTRDHLDFHRDMESYYQAKAALFKSGQVQGKVINRDDPYGRRLAGEVGGDVLTFGMEAGDIRPRGVVESGEWGSRFLMDTPWGEVPVNTPLPGLFNVYNIMAAAGACGFLGVEPQVIGEGLSRVNRVPGRFERVDEGQPWTAVVDYAHTPDALENLLRNARRITPGRILLVFGCGGDRDRSKRPLMGEAAAHLADFAIVTSDNPRGEDPEKIIDEIVNGPGSTKGHLARVSDRREAIDAAVREAKPGDTLLLAGKGHENYQIIGERILPFSDVDELKKAIKRTREAQS